MSKEVVEIVKRQLWRNGVSAKDVSGAGLGFDLIVNEVHKVKVELDTGVKRKTYTAPFGITLAVVREDKVAYYRCDGITCTEAEGVGITKLFSV